MCLKRKRFSGCLLYLILDAEVLPYRQLFDVLRAVAGRGVDIVQLRDKLGASCDTLAFARKAAGWLKGRIPFIVNDRVDIARLSGADGVHLGQEDIPVADARRMLGPKAIIGRSCQSLAHLAAAIREKADYVGFGSVYRTQTKPGRTPMGTGLLVRAAAMAGRHDLPLFAIGGLTRKNIVETDGVQRVAVCRDILLAADPARSVEEWRYNLDLMRE